MSGRSAYARKKATEKADERAKGTRPRTKSSAGSERVTNSELPVESLRREKSGSQSGSSLDGKRDRPGTSHAHRPKDIAYTSSRGRTARTEDGSGVEKSGLRTVLDKKSDDVRKGLAKAFTFSKKKDKKSNDDESPSNSRPESTTTVRPAQGVGQDHVEWSDASISPTRVRGALPGPGADEDGIRNMALPSRSKRMSYVAAGAAPPIKRWTGGGRPAQRWNKLGKDPELWDPNGDVLVFLGSKGQSPALHPSFRLSSHVIEATGSRYLITLLREGSTEEDVHVPASPAGAPPMLQRHGSYRQPAPMGLGHGGQPTPPGSEHSSLWETDGQISYEMYFPAPPSMARLEEIQHHIAIRNVFALLHHASLVGFSLYQALTDLHSSLESYIFPEADNAGTIIDYLSMRSLDDVRNGPETAAGLLAWSERVEVRWEEGWRESFVHCAGMYSRLESCADFKHITPITRALLERASLEIDLRVQAAEERLAAFQYSDMWPPAVAITASTSGPVVAAPAKAAMDRLQNFFVRYYAREFGSWPPLIASGNEGDWEVDTWLTRAVAQLLQTDFGALYDYLVDRDIVWGDSRAGRSRKWMMVSGSGNGAFEPDTPDLPVTDMLAKFDNQAGFPHIPHPYPLVPESIPPSFGSGESSTETFRSKSSNNKANTPAARRAAAAERRIQLAYTEATNMCVLGPEFTHSNLVDAYLKFEKADHIGEVDPFTARRGRWVLIYGVLQTLASVSVDAPTVRHKDGVAYHLSPRLKGAKLPPWKPARTADPRLDVSSDAVHELSHCWTVPAMWEGIIGGEEPALASSSEAEVVLEEQDDEEEEEPVNENEHITPMGYAADRHNYYLFPRPARQQQQQQQEQTRHPRSIRNSRAPSSVRHTTNLTPAPLNTHSNSTTSPTPTPTTATAASISLPSHHQPSDDTVPETACPPPSTGSRRAPSLRRTRPVIPVEEQAWTTPSYTATLAGTTAPGYGHAHGHDHRHIRGLSELDDLLDEDENEDGDGDEELDEKTAGNKADGRGDRHVGSFSRPGGYVGKGRESAVLNPPGGGEPWVDRRLPIPGDGNGNGSGMGTETGGMGPVIRDFDELGVMD